MSGASNVAQVVQVLCAAASGDASLRVPAHQQLQELEARPGFASLLLEAYADASVVPQGRYLAIVMCKNVVDRRWQSRSGHCIDVEEKRHVKARVLQLLKAAAAGSLPHLLELAIVLRRICRSDFPRAWEELGHFVLAELQQVQQLGFSVAALGIVLALHQVLKEQSTKRMLNSRKDFHQIGHWLIEPLGRVWCMKCEYMRKDPNPDLENATMWQLSRYLDGCFLILLTRGFAHLHEEAQGPQMIVLFKEHLGFLLGLLHSRPDLAQKCPFFLKNVKSVLKWWALLLHAHPLAFFQGNLEALLRISIEILQGCAAGVVLPGATGETAQVVEAFVRSSLGCLTHALDCVSYRKGPQPVHEGVTLTAAQACHTQFAEFLRQHPTSALCDLCCQVSLRLPAEEVQAWLEDPEDQLLGPASLTELYKAGEGFVRALCQPPFEQPLVEHIARRMQEEVARPLAVTDPYEIIAHRDTFLVLLRLCHPQLRPHLQVQQLLGFIAPIAALVPQLNDRSPCILLAVRMCSVLKVWAADIPGELLPQVLQMLGGLLRAGCPKAVRLAAVLGPLNAMLERFSDHEAWAQVQHAIINECLNLLTILTNPGSQWRCLNIVHKFLGEEAETGRYEVTEQTLQQLLVLWRQPDQGELLICHALTEVLLALVLMSCHSRQPRLPLSGPLLSCCLVVVSDCFEKYKGSSTGGAGVEAFESAAAALEADALLAASRLGDRGSSTATLFDSGMLLFLGVLRTVDVAQAGQLLGLFPRLLEEYVLQASGEQGAAALHESALDIVLEYSSLYISMAQAGAGAAAFQQHVESLALLCRHCLQRGSPKDRSTERCFQILQLLLAHGAPPGDLSGPNRHVQEILGPVLKLWVTTFSPERGPNFQFPLHSLLPLLCTWQAHHRQHFRQQVCAVAPENGSATEAHVALLLVSCCRLVPPVLVRISVLFASISLVEEGNGGEAFWREFLRGCDEVITTTRRKGPSNALAAALQNLKAATSNVKLPSPVRSAGMLQRAVLAPELLQEAGMAAEVPHVLRSFFGCCARVLQRLAASGRLDVATLLAAAPPQVQEAFRSTGM